MKCVWCGLVPCSPQFKWRSQPHMNVPSVSSTWSCPLMSSMFSYTVYLILKWMFNQKTFIYIQTIFPDGQILMWKLNHIFYNFDQTHASFLTNFLNCVHRCDTKISVLTLMIEEWCFFCHWQTSINGSTAHPVTTSSPPTCYFLLLPPALSFPPPLPSLKHDVFLSVNKCEADFT